MLKKVYLLILSIIILSMNWSVFAQQLQGYVQEVPTNFFGTWRVVAKRLETDNNIIFKEKTTDLWNLSRNGDVIKLSNPFSGASAEITVENSNNESIEFSKTGKLGNKTLTDTVNITIIGDYFTGIDTLRLETLSDIDGSLRKTETAKYSLKGERISGQEIKGE